MGIETIMTTNAIIVAVTIAIIGKILKTTFFQKYLKNQVKWVLPLTLVILGILLMIAITFLNKQTNYGDAILQGMMASIFSQFIYDKIRDNKNKGQQCVAKD